MKKFAAILMAAMLLTGCSTVSESSDIPEEVDVPEQVVSDNSAAEAPEDHATVEADETESTAEAEVELEVPDVLLQPGIWTWTIDGIPAGYYIINDDGLSGGTLSYETGTGAAFDIEVGINEITFHYGSADNSTLYQIVGGDPAYIEMRESDSSPLYVLQYIADGTAADLDGVFFTDMELVEMAEAYYEKQTGSAPESTGAQVNADNTVTVIINDGAAQYTVDRHNAEGFDDLTGEAIMIIPVE